MEYFLCFYFFLLARLAVKLFILFIYRDFIIIIHFYLDFYYFFFYFYLDFQENIITPGYFPLLFVMVWLTDSILIPAYEIYKEEKYSINFIFI